MERVSKFNVDKDTEKRTYEGIVFDSVTEMKFYRDIVCPFEKSGEIAQCKRQVPYQLQPAFEHDGKHVKAIVYVADFVLDYSDGHTEVIDVKGCPDSVAILKRKLFWFTYPEITYKWVSYSKMDGGFLDYEDLKKARAQRKKDKKLKEQKENS